MEPRAPRPGKRLLAVRALSEAGIRTGVFIMPVLPGITDRTASLEAIASAASRAGASYMAHQVLFLMSSAKRSFYPFLSERFPGLLARYRRTYALSAYNTAAYRKRIDLLMESLKKRYDLDHGSDPGEAPCRTHDLQMSLGF
jgi:DNA repair photolyase